LFICCNNILFCLLKGLAVSFVSSPEDGQVLNSVQVKETKEKEKWLFICLARKRKKIL
jgi:hypothetical protein